MRFTIRATSLERCWSGIEAMCYDTSGGFAQSLPAAYHCFCMHLSAPIRSHCRFDGKGSTRLQVRGDIDLLTPGTFAAWREDGKSAMLGVKVSPSLVLSVAEDIGAKPDRVSIPPQFQLRDPHIEHLLWALKAELDCDEPLGRVYAESIGTALVSHLLRRYARAESSKLGNQFSNRRMRRVLDYVHENLSSDLSLFELASVAGLSPTHFKVLFKQSVGMPVHQYIIRRRVEYAVNLIAESNIPLSEIAIQAGFSSPSHMARLTRKITNASPAEIRYRI